MHTSFGQQLRKERKKQRLTVQMLSEACKTSRSYITLIENGHRLPGKKLIPQIAMALNVKNSVVLNWYLEDLRRKLES